jgi:thiol-disulfide isomerase/thioredoxin
MRKTIITSSILLILTACSNAQEQTGGPQLEILDSIIDDNPAVLNFWASWCPFCAHELPAFEQLSKENTEIKVVGINLQENSKVVQNYWAGGGFTFPLIEDPNSELKTKFGVFTQPTTILLNASGEVVNRRDGPMNIEDLVEFVSQITDSKPSDSKGSEDPSDRVIRAGKEYSVSQTPEILRKWSSKFGDKIKHSVNLEEIYPGNVLSPESLRDFIPAIDNPKFISLEEAENMFEDEDLGAVFIGEKTIRFYPFRILNWHEIINDTVDDEAIAVTYCPLCDSSAIYSRKISVGTPTFGVSGFLMDNNLIMYDRETDTMWHQILGEAIAGELTGEPLELLPTNIIDFGTLKSEYPESEVMSTDTGYRMNYHEDPYER